jgi:hypothetical protein
LSSVGKSKPQHLTRTADLDLVQPQVAPLVEEKSRPHQPGEWPAAAIGREGTDAAAGICQQRMCAADGMSRGATAIDGGKGLRQVLDLEGHNLSY